MTLREVGKGGDTYGMSPIRDKQMGEDKKRKSQGDLWARITHADKAGNNKRKETWKSIEPVAAHETAG